MKNLLFLFLLASLLFIACGAPTATETTNQVIATEQIEKLDSVSTEMEEVAKEIEENVKALEDALSDLED